MARVVLTRLEKEILEELRGGSFRIIRVKGVQVKEAAEALRAINFITVATDEDTGVSYYILTSRGLEALSKASRMDSGGVLIDL